MAVRDLSFGHRHCDYVAACAVITLIATALMTDDTGRDISAEHQSR